MGAPQGTDLRQLVEAVAAAARANDLDEAARRAEAAIRAGVRHPLPFRARGLWLSRRGLYQAAVADLEQVLKLGVTDPLLRRELAGCLNQLGRNEDALEQLDKAIETAPEAAELHYARGWLLEQTGALEAARKAHRRSLELQTGQAPVLASLASIAARTGEWDQARALAAEAQAIDPNQATAAIALASAALGEGDAAGAEARLRRLLDNSSLSAHGRALALGLLADALDAQDRTSEAFAAYQAENAEQLRIHGDRLGRGGRGPMARTSLRLLEDFAGAGPEDWPPGARTAAGDGEVRAHVFLVGFPRSGTTFLGQVLGAHPDVVTLDEKANLADAARAFMGDRAGLKRLKAAGEAALDRYRDLYWGRVAKAGGAKVAGKVLVDKLPLNLPMLPIVARLFPAAKVLWLRRDPRDVVFSCFRRHFAVNEAMFEFLTLEGTADFHDVLMRLGETYQAMLPLQIETLAYEALVADLEGETRGLCGRLGLDWSEAMLDFAARADTDAIITPSARQVARGLYGEGVGQWRRYADFLEPVMPKLAPWVERLGYEA